MKTAKVGIHGNPPKVSVNKANPEAVKYGRLWTYDEYRKVAPGEQYAQIFLSQAKPKAKSEILDFGCGTGRGSLMLSLLGDMKVTMIDFVRNCLDKEISEMLSTQPDRLKFLKADLEKPISVNAQYGFCTDVMEHIPTDKVGRVLDNILRASQHVFFSISTTEDSCGALINEKLHLTIKPYSWWLKKFKDRNALIHWSKEISGTCFFYLTAWIDGQDVVDSGVLNVEEQDVRKNVKHNISQGWKQVIPHETNDFESIILGGGPTMNFLRDEIISRRTNGAKLITLNGAYHWALEHGLKPSAQIVVDAREFNKRFTKPIIDKCVYLIASQCHPAVFDGLPKDRTYIWHTAPGLIKDILDAQYETWVSVPGGSTVLLRAIPLMRMLGYRKFHLYGCDSCLINDRHHGYLQSENDKGISIPVTVGDGRFFYAHPWMISQAQEFIQMIISIGDLFDLEIHGDGLLNHILKTGASLTDLKEAKDGSTSLENLS